MKILVVDDSSLQRKNIARILIGEGHEALQAENGAEAIQMTKDCAPELVILDVILPDIMGYDLVKTIKKVAPQDIIMPIIFLSGMNSGERLTKCIVNGGDDYLYKPVSKDLLNAKILVMQRFIDTNRALVDNSRELKTARQLAEQANKSKSLFMANMSHEMRLPLNTIIEDMKDLLIKDDIPEQYKQDLVIVNKSSEKLLNLVNSILDLSKIESGAIELSLNIFSADSFLESIYKMFSGECNKKNIELIFENNSSRGIYLFADEQKLSQILINIISNSIEFTVSGGITVTFSRDNDSEQSTFVIQDTSPGMNEEDLSSLFLGFKQGKSGENSEITGLSMSIVNSYVDLMHGDISVTSTLGKGTCFTVSLPLEVKPAPSV